MSSRRMGLRASESQLTFLWEGHVSRIRSLKILLVAVDLDTTDYLFSDRHLFVGDGGPVLKGLV